MGALGRAFAKGVSGAANTAAAALFKDYEREGETASKMTLADHAASLQEKLELQRQKFQSGENALTRTAENDRHAADIAQRRTTADQAYASRLAELSGQNAARDEQARHNRAQEGIAARAAAITEARHKVELPPLVAKEFELASSRTTSLMKARADAAKDGLATPEQLAQYDRAIQDSQAKEQSIIDTVRPPKAPKDPDAKPAAEEKKGGSSAPAAPPAPASSGGALKNPYRGMDEETLKAVLSGGEATPAQVQQIEQELKKREALKAARSNGSSAAPDLNSSFPPSA